MVNKRKVKIPADLREAIDLGYDYDSELGVEENRERASGSGHILPELVGDQEFAEWRGRGRKLAVKFAVTQWEIGDWIVEGEDLKEIAGMTRNQRFKHSIYKAASDETGIPIPTLKLYAYVSRNVQFEVRNPALGIGHHHAVAPLEPDQQKRFLDEFAMGALSVEDARKRIGYVLGRKSTRAAGSDAKAKQTIKLCESLLKVLSANHLSAATPAVSFALLDTVTKTQEVLSEEIFEASLHNDAER